MSQYNRPVYWRMHLLDSRHFRHYNQAVKACSNDIESVASNGNNKEEVYSCMLISLLSLRQYDLPFRLLKMQEGILWDATRH